MFFGNLFLEIFEECTILSVANRCFIVLFFFNKTFGKMFGIAAEQDIGSPPCHVRRNRHTGIPSRLRRPDGRNSAYRIDLVRCVFATHDPRNPWLHRVPSGGIMLAAGTMVLRLCTERAVG